MTDTATTATTLPAVFATLAATAREYAASDRVLYGAQAKKLLMANHPGFSEHAFGYAKFLELLIAGRDAGLFELETPNGHPRILPAGSATSAETAAPPTGRLKADVWNTFVLWGDGERWWDAKHRRAIFVPTDEAGTPLWRTSPEDFVRVSAVTMSMQLRWMEEFASEQEPPVRTELVAALHGEAQGEFKYVLNRVNLTFAWRDRLRQRVTSHALTWAAENGLPADAILERSERQSRSSIHTRSAGDKAERAVATAPSPPSEPSSSGDDPASALRVRLHEVIDQMGIAELAALQIPAVYLLRS